MGSSLDMSSSYCSGEWLHVGGEPLLHASEALELQQLLEGFTGISHVFLAPVDPQTHENILYTGKHYSLAFLIEAALKDKIRQVDADYHKPWDEEVTQNISPISLLFTHASSQASLINTLSLFVFPPTGVVAVCLYVQLLLNLISWIFAYNVRYFSASNILRQRARAKQQEQKQYQQMQEQKEDENDLAAWQRRWAEQLDMCQQEQEQQQEQQKEENEIQLLDRIDMIFCMQGYDTLLIHEFLLECLQRSVREEKRKRSSTGLCVAALRCLRQLLRMMELHGRSRTVEIRAAVQQQFERWIGSGIVSDLSYVLRRYKPRSMDPKVFLFGAECALSLLSLVQQLGGTVCANVEGLKARRTRKTQGAAAAAFWDEDEQQQLQQQRTRQVTLDDIRSDFFRGDIISNCMSFVSLSRELG